MTPSEQKDDAIHIDSPVALGMTLCGQHRYRVWNTVRLGDPRPDAGSGCWTCLEKAAAMDAALSGGRINA